MADISFKVVRSSRRTIAIQVLPDGTVVVRCPNRASNRDIQRMIESHRDWILARLARMPRVEKLTEAQLEQLRQEAKGVFSQRVAAFAPMVGVTYGNITIRFQSTRWGSCSSKGNLNFNALLLLAPPEVLDYVVVHELCHRKEMNHSQKFWALVGKTYPGYTQCRKWLKQNGGSLMARMPK